jgi:hypothetical protein
LDSTSHRIEGGASRIELKVLELKNLTTDYDFFGRLVKRREPHVEFIELGKEHMILELPAKKCGVGSRLMIKVETLNGHEDVIAEATGKVEKLEDVGDDLQRVDIKLTQFNAEVWNQFLDIFAKRQEAVTRLFEAMKE